MRHHTSVQIGITVCQALFICSGNVTGQQGDRDGCFITAMRDMESVVTELSGQIDLTPSRTVAIWARSLPD